MNSHIQQSLTLGGILLAEKERPDADSEHRLEHADRREDDRGEADPDKALQDDPHDEEGESEGCPQTGGV